MRRLKHKNIIKLYDTIQNEKYIYIIMEYCKYGDLRNFLKSKPINEYKTQIIMKQIISGLKYLYDNKVFHRDLKPQNILVSKNCIIKITDFGLAKEYEENILSDTICGSPIYMAPEIIKNDKYSNKADIWSLGVIFYELLTGETPYKVKKYDELVSSIKNKDVIIPKYLKISNNARDLLSKLLIKDSDDRITWYEIFNHPWISTDLTNSILFKSKIKKISNNKIINKFNKTINYNSNTNNSNTNNSNTNNSNTNNSNTNNSNTNNSNTNNSNTNNSNTNNSNTNNLNTNNLDSIDLNDNVYNLENSNSYVNLDDKDKLEEHDEYLSDNSEEMFSIEIDNCKLDKTVDSFYNHSYNETDSSMSTKPDLNLSTLSKNKYDFIDESFSKYDESIEYIQKQNESKIINNIYNYLNNSTLFVKSLINNKK